MLISVFNGLEVPIWYAQEVDCGLSFWFVETCEGTRIVHKQPCIWRDYQHNFTKLEPGETLEGRRSSDQCRMRRKEASALDATPLHVADFVECVRTRKRPLADIEIGHRSSIVPHLGNIAYKMGRKLKWDARKEQIIGDPEASTLLARQARAPWNIL